MHRELIFYDYEFNPLGRASGVSDIYYKEMYNGIGTFEAELDADGSMAAELMDRDYTVAVWDGLQAVITSVRAAEGEGVLKVYGRTPNWLLSRRACPNFGHRTGEPHALAHRLTEEVWGDSIVTGSGADIKTGEITFWRNVYNPLSEVVADCLDRAGGGHRVVFDTRSREWRFETYEGRRRRLMFSADRRSAAGMTYSRSVLDHYNGGFYTTDEDEKVWKELPSDREGIYRWTARLTSSGASSAESELKRKKIENSVDFTALGLRRGVDYELGDIVYGSSLFGRKKVTGELRVAAVERWASYNDSGERPLLESV